MKARNKQVLATLMSIALTIGAGRAAAEVIVSDSFESGDMSAPGYEGFSWGANNRTSVVNSTGVLWNNGPRNVARPSDRDWTARDGEHSLRFRYPAHQEWAEQRFNLSDGYPELWMSFWIRIPVNFNLIPGPTKFFALWMDGYSAQGDGSTVWMNYTPEGNMAITHSTGGFNTSQGYMDSVPVFDPIKDRGKWFKFIVRVEIESSPGAKDGSMQVWHKREGDEKLVLSHEVNNWELQIPEDGPKGWSEGYLLGWVNGPYPEDTEWLLDDFTLSSDPLISESKPNPPEPR